VTRLAASVAAVLLAGAMAVSLFRDARTARHNGETIAETLTRYSAQASSVVIVFQPEDCLGNGDMVRRWNELALAPGLRVRGLVVGNGSLSPAQRKVFARTGLRLSVHAISSEDASRLGGMLGHTRTPFVLVLDGRGRLAGSFPASQNVPPDAVTMLVSGS
jgi:hypothetical protein